MNNLFKLSLNKVESNSFANQNSNKFFVRFFSKKINLVFTVLLFLFIIWILLSLFLYPYKYDEVVLNSHLSYNLPNIFNPYITKSFNYDNEYDLIIKLASENKIEIIKTVYSENIVSLTYNPYKLINALSLEKNNIEILHFIPWFGTNNEGYDNYSIFINSFGITILISIISCFIAILVGNSLGTILAYRFNFNLSIDKLLISTISLIPSTLISILLFNIFGYKHWLAIIILSIIMIPVFFFSAYPDTKELKNSLLIDAYKVNGYSQIKIIFNVIFPRVLARSLSLVIDQFTVVILILSSISFYNVEGIKESLNIGNLFKYILDNFSDFYLTSLVIFGICFYIVTLKILTVNLYICSKVVIR
ncbi:ABC transporter permease subunit [Mycoplasmopsis anatis]|uniref:Oligopeptide ABC transporter, permease protein n=1 Tax=Mycoplasmopsis anatis 1340 TaxID=1034808 RepID=F9QE64_9BACT|nr:ABC transporter permease subunit [Mycoplasmopsis anatis]AWX69838.1 ABC transporter permease subunit [Mycoplasmopsis anatis]EGS28949.1 oligopeptide ABC transporter, permease protein [Mycoplasmopsis anatis 1340]VEU73741.1 ABC-type antimicrobial peptide transport system, permease component [Mycoplasmopsis anatis]